MHRDDNRVPVIGAVTNDASLTPISIRVNSANNGLLVDTAIFPSQSVMDHGALSSIGSTALQLTATDFDAVINILLVAADNNPENLYVGNSDVTAGTTAATDGIIIEAGRRVEIEIDNPNKLYIIADSAGASTNKVYWIAI